MHVCHSVSTYRDWKNKLNTSFEYQGIYCLLITFIESGSVVSEYLENKETDDKTEIR